MTPNKRIDINAQTSAFALSLGPRETSAMRRTLGKTDFVIGTLIALAMAITFTILSPGRALIVTFVPGVLVSWAIFAWLFFERAELPSAAEFLPLFFGVLGIQFLHFAEEFATGFANQFPALYGGETIPDARFVAFNMIAYAIFSWACLLVFTRGQLFLLVPVLFFITYGAMGNAIAHVWWSIYLGAYFPGLFTALPYWVLGPLALLLLLESRRAVAVAVASLALILVTALTIFMSPS